MSAINCEDPVNRWPDLDKRLQWMEAQLCRERADLAHTSARLRHVLERLSRHPRIWAIQPQPLPYGENLASLPPCLD